MFALLGQQIDEIEARIKEVDAKLNAAHKASAVSQRLVTIPGVGPVTALTLAVEIDPAMFESGRHLAAWARGRSAHERSALGRSARAWPVRSHQPRRAGPCVDPLLLGRPRRDPRPRTDAPDILRRRDTPTADG